MIHLQNNHIKNISDAFTNLKALKELRLDKNNLESIGVEDLEGCLSLTHLYLNFNKLNNVDVRSEAMIDLPVVLDIASKSGSL